MAVKKEYPATKIRKRLRMLRYIGVLATAVAMAATIGGVAQAATVSAQPAPTSPVHVTQQATDSSGNVIYPVGCWTTFVPKNPGGMEMTQYYVNCSNEEVTVCLSVTIPGSATFVYRNYAQLLYLHDGEADQTDTAIWRFPTTAPNGQYSTVFC